MLLGGKIHSSAVKDSITT